MSADRVDFAALATELLRRADALVPEWLPGGKRDGAEWKCGSLCGEPGSSCSINLSTGKWGDFATDDMGGDLVSLYAAIHSVNQGAAARELIAQLGLHTCIETASGRSREGGQSADPSRRRQGKPAADSAKKYDTPQSGEFVPVIPVPPHAPAPPARHTFRGEPTHVWKYARDGQLYGYVYRFTNSTGDKEIYPLTWCQSQVNGIQKWVWKQWDEPRPLYLPGGSLRPGLVRVVVEGEKCADALHQLLGDEFDVVSWPGGGKAVPRAAWDWLPARSRVIVWPDADCKRRKPTKEEKAAGFTDVDPRLDYQPMAKQPGAAAANAVAQILDGMELEVWIGHLDAMPAAPDQPPARPDGWDCVDAIAGGWSATECRDYLKAAKRWVRPAPPLVEDALGAAAASGTSADPDPANPKAWRLGLIKNSDGQVKAVRENIELALQSIPETRGKIAYNEFTNDVFKLSDMPWGSPAGKWDEVDELLMGAWLVRGHNLPSMPRTMLEEGMRMVATRNKYHPVREYIEAQTWDGTPRLKDWLIRAVVGKPEELAVRTRKYLQRVGTWFVMGMVMRAMRPGCKFDYMMILEGTQGMRKSTVLNVLAGDWFADTGFVLGDKDSLQMLQGRWLYEISELDAMARAEVTKIKAFIASSKDWYRASFDKRPREYPRQLVFAGTTNEHQYLVDGTGNRRFWPVEVTRVIDTDYVAEVRDQMFAEAWARLQKGERYHPTTSEEVTLFMPQQRTRMVESPIEMRILDHLVNHAEGRLANSWQTVTLLSAIGIDITKLGPGRFHEKQCGTALRKFGWTREKAARSVPGRPWIFKRPEGWPDCLVLDDLDEDLPSEPPAPADSGPPVVEDEDRIFFEVSNDEGSDAPF